MAHCIMLLLAVVFIAARLQAFSLSRIQQTCEDKKDFVYQNRSCESLSQFGACYSMPEVNRSCAKSCVACDCNNGTDVVRKQEGHAKKELRLKDCCSSKGVSPGKCQNLCSFRTTTTDMFNAGLVYIGQLPEFMNCAAHDKPKLECCAFFKVPEVCKPMCSGTLRAIGIEHVPCLSFAQQILGCHNAGYNNA